MANVRLKTTVRGLVKRELSVSEGSNSVGSQGRGCGVVSPTTVSETVISPLSLCFRLLISSFQLFSSAIFLSFSWISFSLCLCAVSTC